MALVIITGDWELYQSLNSKVEKNKVYFLAFEERNQTQFIIVF
jgi:hypothetical protein